MICVAKKLLAAVLFLLSVGRPTLAGVARTWLIDDFEDGDLRGASGLSWIVIADDLMGGKTDARLESARGGASGSRHALALRGRLGDAAPRFAGAWASLDGRGRAVDLRAFEGIRLRVRGPARIQVGFRANNVNFMKDVDAGAAWKEVEIPFAALAPAGKVPEGTRWTGESVLMFGVTTPQDAKDVPPGGRPLAVEIDEVMLYGRSEQRLEPIPSGPPSGYATAPFTPLTSVPASGWSELATDPEGDGKAPNLPDATRLEAIASADDVLWVRVALRETPSSRWFGMNVALDVDGDPTNGTPWWGQNGSFKFDRLVTVYCFRVADRCEGFVGAADAGEVAQGVLASGSDSVRFVVDRERRSLILGIPRSALHLKADSFRMVAAVGSALVYSDDVPGQGSATLR